MQCFIKEKVSKHFCLEIFNSLYDKIWIVCINNECEREFLQIKPAKHVTNMERKKVTCFYNTTKDYVYRKTIRTQTIYFRIFFFKLRCR